MPPFPIYINGLGNISPQKTLGNQTFLEEVVGCETNILKCQEPNYRDFVSGDLVRRMSRLIKMGISASKVCLQDAECQNPDAIITGTGLGCVEDTEKFLTCMIKNNEEFLTPTSFIQSTHNTVGAQIALMLKCHNYNFTYVHRGFSFESALLDARLQIQEGDLSNILVGGIDEMTNNSFLITSRLGHWKRKSVNNLRILESGTKGSIAGEGASFFLVSGNKTSRTYAVLSDQAMILRPRGIPEVITECTKMVDQNNLSMKEIDLVLLGLNGDCINDKHYLQFISALPDSDQGYFKHLCGEYQTASSFGLWLASMILQRQSVPEVIRLKGKFNRPIRTILLYNHYQNLNHTLALISRAL